MPSLRQIFNSLKMISFLSLFIPTFSYAEEVDLPCCEGVTCPTTEERPGEPGVVQTATFKGVSVVIDDERELLTTVFGDPGYREWRAEILERFGREAAKPIIKSSRPIIFARCSGSVDAATISRQTKVLVCPEGDGVFLTQNDPICEDPATGPHGVVEITRVSKREQDEKVAALEARISELRVRRDGLDAEHMANDALVIEYDRRIQEREDLMFGPRRGGATLAAGLMFGGVGGSGF